MDITCKRYKYPFINEETTSAPDETMSMTRFATSIIEV